MPSKYVINADALEKDDEDKAEVIEIQATPVIHHKPYAGMTPEDLDRFSNTPFWIHFRRVSFIVFILSWLALLVCTVAFIIVYKRCEPVPPQNWWHSASVYQIYVPSFQDSDGDGLGDLKGVSRRLDELQYLGVNTIVLSSIYAQQGHNERSLMDDLVTDVFKIDSRLGNESDIVDLAQAAKLKDIRVVLELPINHVSWNNSWFANSEARKPGFENFFLWSSKTCNQSSVPNNWQTAAGDSAWTYSAVREECYYHRHSKQMPDLNWRSSLVQHKMKEAIEFWLNKGVDGFLLTSAIYMFEDFDLRNEPNTKGTPIRTRDLTETVDTIKRLRAFVHNISEEAVVFIDVGDDSSRLQPYIEFGDTPVADLAISRVPVEVLNANCSASCFWNMMQNIKGSSNVLLGDRRVNRRLVGRYPNVKAATLIYSAIPGALITLYGDELGLSGLRNVTDSFVGALTIMRWTNGTDGEFTTGRPWISGSADERVNFYSQKDAKGSNLEFLRGLLNLRKEYGGLRYGKISPVSISGSILSFVRHFDGTDSFLVVANVGNREEKDIEIEAENFPSDAYVVADTETGMVESKGSSVSLNDLSLKPKQAKLLRWNYRIKEQL